MGEVSCPFCGKRLYLKGNKCSNCNSDIGVVYRGAENNYCMTNELRWSTVRSVLRGKK